jgi:subtilisin family serine protease
VTSRRPAYSDAFVADSLQAFRSRLPIAEVTPEWAWGGSTGAGVKVAVLDSGIDAEHPAIDGRVEGYLAISDGPDGLIYDPAPHTDLYGHGTACAGIIRALAPDCELYSVRTLNGALSGHGTVFAAGLRWAIEHGMHVCNLSLGTTKKDYFGVFHELTDLAYFRNVLLVAAANNMPIPSFPSVYSSVIAVAAHDEPEPYRFYANPAPPVEFGAYGIDVRVAWQRGRTVTTTGNSFAAPHITGIVARILAKHPGLTLYEMKSVLRALAANAAPATQTSDSLRVPPE